jgi:hypothetical protein
VATTTTTDGSCAVPGDGLRGLLTPQGPPSALSPGANPPFQPPTLVYTHLHSQPAAVQRHPRGSPHSRCQAAPASARHIGPY